MKRSLSPGASISRYSILSRLGAGGMGEVYLARDKELGRSVALKILPSDLVGDADRVRRFVQEARSASALNHPHIVTIYEIGEAESDYAGEGDQGKRPMSESSLSPDAARRLHYIAMEFVDGQTLGAKIHRERTELKRLLEYLAQVADGLAKAHAAGIVHRDLKPDNVMIAHDGYAKILDFGLAKLIEANRPQGDDIAEADTLMQQTMPGLVMGTVGYMSPEQVQGKAVDQRSDIFSFGCILYEAATGHKPFDGESVIDSMHRIIYAQAPPIREFNPGTPAELQRIIRKCLSKNPDERYQSIKDVALDLRDLIKEYESLPPVSATDNSFTSSHAPLETGSAPTIVTTTARGGPGRRTLFAVAAIAVLAAAAFGLYRFLSGGPSRRAEAFRTIAATRLTNTGKAGDAAISPDGKYVVHVVNDAGQQSLWVRQVATSSNVQIVPPVPDVTYGGLTFSKDGDYIYYISIEKNSALGVLYQIPVLGGNSKKVLEDVDSPVTFSPDGKRFAFRRDSIARSESSLMIANADGSDHQPLVTHNVTEFFTAPAWSPDGKVIAAPVYNRAEASMSLVGVRVEDGAERPITSERWLGVFNTAWLSDGSGLILAAIDRASRLSQIWHLDYATGQARKITTDLNNYIGLSLTANSNTIVTVQTDTLTNFWVAPGADPSRAAQVTSGAGKYNGLAWTPDGRIVYGSMASGNWEIWIINADGTGQRQLTSNAGVNVFPSVSLDRRYILFNSNRASAFNTFHVWRMDLSGGNPKQLTNGSGEIYPQPSPDGRWVVYTSTGAGIPTLWRVPMDGGEPVQITDRFSSLPTVSPDGKLVACISWDGQSSSQWEIVVLPFEGGELKKIPNIPLGHVAWSRDGRALRYSDQRAGVANIYSQPLAGGPPKKLTDFKSDLIFDFAWSLDEKQFACLRGIVTSDVVLIKEP